MKKKSMNPTVKFVLSVISLMIGIVWVTASITVFSSMTAAVKPGGVVVLLLFSALFLTLGIRGLLRWRSQQQAGGKKPGKAVIAILSAMGVLLLAEMVLVLPATWQTGRLNSTLQPYVQESWSDGKGTMPEHPRFVFYNMTTGQFSVPSRGTYPQGTSDPKETNVVVAYRESVQKDGVWVDKSTGKNVGAGLKQKVSLYVIRLDDWSLITQADFSVQLDYGENGRNVLHMNQVESYLNNLFEE